MADILRPFHETIVDAIRNCGTSHAMLFAIFPLIKATKIPAGHDEIIEAIDYFFVFAGAQKFARDIREVKASLLAQKVTAQQKAAAKPEAIGTLDELQTESVALVTLLEDHEDDLTSLLLCEQLKKVNQAAMERLSDKITAREPTQAQEPAAAVEKT